MDDDSESGNCDFSTNRDLEINLVSCLGWNRDPDPGKQPSSSHPALPPTHLNLLEGWGDDIILNLSSVSGAAAVATISGLNNGEIKLTSRFGPQGTGVTKLACRPEAERIVSSGQRGVCFMSFLSHLTSRDFKVRSIAHGHKHTIITINDTSGCLLLNEH